MILGPELKKLHLKYVGKKFGGAITKTTLGKILKLFFRRPLEHFGHFYFNPTKFQATRCRVPLKKKGLENFVQCGNFLIRPKSRFLPFFPE